MALTYKVVNGVAPNAATDTTLYTCPASTTAVVTQLSILNTDGSVVARVKIYVCDGGGATNVARQVLDVDLGADNTGNRIGLFPWAFYTVSPSSLVLSIRWHLAATDTLVASFTGAGNGTVSFRPTILEIT